MSQNNAIGWYVRRCSATKTLVLLWCVLGLSSLAFGQAGVFKETVEDPLSGKSGQPRVALDGRIYLPFSNYDVWLESGPLSLNGAGNSPTTPGSRVIFKNAHGMHWDGAGYVWHPAYRLDLVTRNYYQNRIAGHPGLGVWPSGDPFPATVDDQHSWREHLEHASFLAAPSWLAGSVTGAESLMQPWVINDSVPKSPPPPVTFPDVTPYRGPSSAYIDRMGAIGFEAEFGSSHRQIHPLDHGSQFTVPVPETEAPWFGTEIR